MNQELFTIVGFFLIAAFINTFWGAIAVRAVLRPFVMMMNPDYDGGKLAARIGGDYRGALVWATLIEQGSDLTLLSFAGWGLISRFQSPLSWTAFVIVASPKVYFIVDALACKIRGTGYPVGARSFTQQPLSDGSETSASSGP